MAERHELPRDTTVQLEQSGPSRTSPAGISPRIIQIAVLSKTSPTKFGLEFGYACFKFFLIHDLQPSFANPPRPQKSMPR